SARSRPAWGRNRACGRRPQRQSEIPSVRRPSPPDGARLQTAGIGTGARFAKNRSLKAPSPVLAGRLARCTPRAPYPGGSPSLSSQCKGCTTPFQPLFNLSSPRNRFIVAVMRAIPLFILFATSCWAEGTFGTWKMNPARSTFNGSPHPESFTVRIEPHARGEVFTLDKTEEDGRATTSSTILYLDGKPRDFQDPGCSGTQSSRRVG